MEPRHGLASPDIGSPHCLSVEEKEEEEDVEGQEGGGSMVICPLEEGGEL